MHPPIRPPAARRRSAAPWAGSDTPPPATVSTHHPRSMASTPARHGDRLGIRRTEHPRLGLRARQRGLHVQPGLHGFPLGPNRCHHVVCVQRLEQAEPRGAHGHASAIADHARHRALTTISYVMESIGWISTLSRAHSRDNPCLFHATRLLTTRYPESSVSPVNPLSKIGSERGRICA